LRTRVRMIILIGMPKKSAVNVGQPK